MACHLFGDKPLSKPMTGYRPLDPYEWTSLYILIKIQNFSLTKICLKILSVKLWPFCPGGPLFHRMTISSAATNIRDSSHFNSLWPSDAIWRQRSGSTLAQVMACCLIAPSHYLNQCWLIINEVQWHSYQGNYTRDASTINHKNLFENYMSKMSFKIPRGQWIKLIEDNPYPIPH